MSSAHQLDEITFTNYGLICGFVVIKNLLVLYAVPPYRTTWLNTLAWLGLILECCGVLVGLSAGLGDTGLQLACWLLLLQFELLAFLILIPSKWTERRLELQGRPIDERARHLEQCKQAWSLYGGAAVLACIVASSIGLAVWWIEPSTSKVDMQRPRTVVQAIVLGLYLILLALIPFLDWGWDVPCWNFIRRPFRPKTAQDGPAGLTHVVIDESPGKNGFAAADSIAAPKATAKNTKKSAAHSGPPLTTPLGEGQRLGSIEEHSAQSAQLNQILDSGEVFFKPSTVRSTDRHSADRQSVEHQPAGQQQDLGLSSIASINPFKQSNRLDNKRLMSSTLEFMWSSQPK